MKFYKDGEDYLLVGRALRRGIHEVAAPEKPGNPASVELSVVTKQYLADCEKVRPDEVPYVWRACLSEAWQ